MMLGLSSYSLDPAIASGEMTLYDAIDWAAAQGAECMELVPFSFTFMDDERHIDSEYIKKVVRHAKDAGIKLCNYSVLVDLCKEDPDALRDEVARVKRHVDVAVELGVPVMRHDVSAFRRPHGENGLEYFEKLMPLMVESAGAIADHAAQYGITTLIENHGFFANGCDRVERIIRAVNRPNYGLLLDTGNIACVDEDPAVAAQRLASKAKMIHLKDFYIRKKDRMLPQDGMYTAGAKPAKPYVMPTPEEFRKMPPSLGYVGTASGLNILRGSILGQGDMDIWAILKTVKDAGYDKEVSIEFEGMEDCVAATDICLKTARYIWDRV